jgi:hypothetical protein
MRGERELNKYESGGRLTIKQMVLAKCYECMGKYADGKADCMIPECSLYPLMPYGALAGQYKVRKGAPHAPVEAKTGIDREPVSHESSI